MATKITGLTPLNIRALREMDVKAEMTATTATFPGSATDALLHLDRIRNAWPGDRHAHPYASTSAVRRKLVKAIG